MAQNASGPTFARRPGFSPSVAATASLFLALTVSTQAFNKQ